MFREWAGPAIPSSRSADAGQLGGPTGTKAAVPRNVRSCREPVAPWPGSAVELRRANEILKSACSGRGVRSALGSTSARCRGSGKGCWLARQRLRGWKW